MTESLVGVFKTLDFPQKRNNFHYIIKSSLLKLLCSLARLCKGNPLQQLQLDFFGINTFLESSLTISISQFFLTAKQNKGKGAQIPYEHAPLPNCPTPATSCPPNTYRLSPSKLSAHCAISCCRSPLEECFPCVSRSHFSIQSPCSSFDVPSVFFPNLDPECTYGLSDIFLRLGYHNISRHGIGGTPGQQGRGKGNIGSHSGEG